MTYIACTLVNLACAILFRYADFVSILGGTELNLGWIVGVGMIGSVLARLSLGAAIDQRGPRIIWLVSLGVFALTCFAHLAVTRCDGLGIVLLRVMYCTAIAGIFGASTTFISGRVNMARMAELVGLLGTSGFLGMMLGTHLGDLLLGSQEIQRHLVDRMFVVAGLIGLAAMPFAWIATRRAARPAAQDRTPILAVLRQYRPGFVLIIGVVSGAAFSLPQTFLRTYAAELDISRIGIFFTTVAATAVVTRVVTRQLPDRLGLSTMIFIGLGLMAVAQLLYLVVRTEWQLVLPGLPYGLGQAILYPMVAAVATGPFPLRYRGLGITLVLASFDVGQLIGAPSAGAIVHACESFGVSGYPTLFVTTAVVLVLAGGAYWRVLQRQARLQPAVPEPAILRFPRTAVQRRKAATPRKPADKSVVREIVTSRSHAGNSRSTAAGRR
jgi:MFS family permease